MDLKSGYPWWAVRNGLLQAFPPLEQDLRCDVLVVGGDFATTFEDAIALQSAQCRKDAACSKRFPTDTRAQLRSVVDT
ncbi:hypothetical protein, partial [Stenotrophomonas sp. 3diitr2024]|uniref:hypothetical protein n=1 Tax=Stenotrophomonas sp. 3diitr2024 TaxID=3345115 RepID=UPI0035CC4192